MAVSVRRIGELVDGVIVGVRPVLVLAGDFVARLTNLEYRDTNDPSLAWGMELLIGQGPSAKLVVIDLPSFLTTDQYEISKNSPLFLHVLERGETPDQVFALFRNSFFVAQPRLRNDAMKEEAILRMKKVIYAEDAELAGLRSYVANMEAAIEYERGGSKRVAIPDDVKLVVWARDGGACVRCNSKNNLHFDHVIPVVKGGSNLAENIQLLCQPCNLRKSSKIAF